MLSLDKVNSRYYRTIYSLAGLTTTRYAHPYNSLTVVLEAPRCPVRVFQAALQLHAVHLSLRCLMTRRRLRLHGRVEARLQIAVLLLQVVYLYAGGDKRKYVYIFRLTSCTV